MENERAVIIEENMQIAYDKYLKIVQEGLWFQLPESAGRRVGTDGCQFSILSGVTGAPYLSYRPLKYVHPDDLEVIAHAYIECEATYRELMDFLPGELAFSAVCTAEKVHKFIAPYQPSQDEDEWASARKAMVEAWLAGAGSEYLGSSATPT